MTNVRGAVALAALSLQQGTSKKIVCPSCLGGSTGDATMSVSRDVRGVLLWHCHRASCGLGGRDGDSLVPVAVKKPEVRSIIEYNPVPLTPDYESWLCTKFNLKLGTLTKYGFRYDQGRARVLQPVVDHNGVRVGWLGRSYKPDVVRKVLTAVPAGWPVLSLLHPKMFGEVTADNVLVVVEDMVSAVALLALGIPACALSGTHMSQDMEAVICTFLRMYGTHRVYVALDKDATAKSIGLSRKLALHIATKPLPLEKDIKNMTQHERTVLLQEVSNEAQSGAVR